MHKIVSIPEIVTEIFAHLTRWDHTRCARVCEAWADLAQDHLLADVEDPREIFKLLVPLDPKRVCFSWTPTGGEWDAFRSNYAHRVRAFKATPDMNEIMATICDAHLRAPLFPNLRILKWRDELDCKFMLPFANPGLLTLDIRNESRKLPSFSSPLPTILGAFSSYAPNLSKLSVFYDKPQHCPDITLYLSYFTAVRDIEFVPFRASRADIEAISKIPRLQSLSFNYSPSRWYFEHAPFTEPADEARLEAANLADDSFCDLRYLDLVATLPEVTWLMSGKGYPLALRTLYLYTPSTPHWTSVSELHEFLSILAQRIPGLEELFMCFAPAGVPDNFHHSSFPDADWSTMSVDYDELHHLCAFKALRVLKIHLAHPLKIGDQELGDLLEELPTIEQLYLNADPLFNSEFTPNLSMNVFPLIAARAPNLTRLGLFINTEEFSTGELAEIDPWPRFRALRRLDLGRTYVGTSEVRRNLAIRVCLVLPLHSGSIDLCWGTSGLSSGLEAEKDDEDRTEFGMELDAMLQLNHLAAKEVTQSAEVAEDNGPLTTMYFGYCNWVDQAEYI